MSTTGNSRWRGTAFAWGLLGLFGLIGMLTTDKDANLDSTSWTLFWLPTVIAVLLFGSCAACAIVGLGAIASVS